MNYDIAIIGAGPGGYAAAIRAAQIGASVLLIEKEFVGGTCLNYGCIPSKSIIASAEKYSETKKIAKFGINAENVGYDYNLIAERKNTVVEKLRKSLSQLIKSYSIDIVHGCAEITGINELKILSENEEKKVNFKNLLIAVGSRPCSIPNLHIDHEFIMDSNDILNLKKLPESVLIVGSGAIGVEWARIFASFGKKVYLAEIAEKLVPLADTAVSERIERLFKKSKIEFYKETSINEISDKKVILSNGKSIEPEKILVAAGRSPNIQNIGLDNVSVELNGKFIKVGTDLKTNIDNIYAIGDVNGICQLAHAASHQGVAVVEHILLNKPVNINYSAIPSVIYGNPEIASVGETEQSLILKNADYKSSVFPLGAIGKAIVEDEIDGFVKILSVNEKIVGAHIVAPQASAIIQQAVIAINAGLSSEDLRETVFAHPTYSEALHEAVLGLDNMSLHLPKQE